ncbi:TPA: hypothetical protein PBT35_002643 [Staphylococcus aureus]|nr:hypothetical protein [Staphylococcus aureus]
MANENQDSYIRLTDEEKELLEQHKKKKRKWIVRGIVALIIILIALAIYFFIASKGASGQINEFDNAVKHKDYKKLTEIIKSGQKSINTIDAKHFIEYVNQPENRERYNSEIKKMKKALNDEAAHDSTIGKITDKNGHTIVDVTQNGNRFLFLNDLAFEPNFYNVYLKEGNNTASYEFKNNGSQRKVVSNANNETELGQFFVGNYNVEVIKSFKEKPLDGSVDGHLHVNTDQADKNKKLEAKEDIPQAWFKVKLKNNEELDKDYKILIDGEEVDYEKNKIYGKYPADAPIAISAVGRANNQSLETKESEVKANKEDKAQTIELTFKESDIEKQRKINKDIEKDAEKFMKAYTKKLNTGYEGFCCKVKKYS